MYCHITLNRHWQKPVFLRYLEKFVDCVAKQKSSERNLALLVTFRKVERSIEVILNNMLYIFRTSQSIQMGLEWHEVGSEKN